MVLRLSSSSSSSSSSSNNNNSSSPALIASLLDRLVQDAALSTSQKVDCLKTLKVILKYLLDPTKHADVEAGAKYCTLKLDNEKLKQKLLAYPIVRRDLLVGVLGFAEQADVLVADFDSMGDYRDSWQLCHDQAAQKLVLLTESPTMSVITNNKNNKTAAGSPKLSEKQKARRLMEAKELAEKKQAKLERQRQVELIRADKHVRENDPNWKPGVSAAAHKSGAGISTFRDKYGE